MASGTININKNEFPRTTTSPVISSSGGIQCAICKPNEYVVSGTVVEILPLGSTMEEVSIAVTISASMGGAYINVNDSSLLNTIRSHTTLAKINWNY